LVRPLDGSRVVPLLTASTGVSAFIRDEMGALTPGEGPENSL
jgi:hypothetical protein